MRGRSADKARSIERERKLGALDGYGQVDDGSEGGAIQRLERAVKAHADFGKIFGGAGIRRNGIAEQNQLHNGNRGKVVKLVEIFDLVVF